MEGKAGRLGGWRLEGWKSGRMGEYKDRRIENGMGGDGRIEG